MSIFWFLFIHYMHKKPKHAVLFGKENMSKYSDKNRDISI